LYLQLRHTETIADNGELLEEMRDALKQYETIVPDTGTAEIESADTITETETIETQEPESVAESESTPEKNIESDTESVSESDTLDTTPVQPVIVRPEQTLDFTSLRNLNTDIYAWLEIPDTKVDYPVLQSKTDDSCYLTTAYDGSYYIGGSLFTESAYNSDDFNDPVTIIYGHTMRNGTLFGQLQSIYSNAASFVSNQDIKLYLPGEVRHYTVFAAVPYDSEHILYRYDFSNQYWYNNFFKNVMNIRTLGAQFDKEITPAFGDRVIILSTCLTEDSTKRFLVMAVYNEDITG